MSNDIEVYIAWADGEEHIGKVKLVCAQGLWDPRFEGLGVENLIGARDNVLMQFNPKVHRARVILTPIENVDRPDHEPHIIRGED